MRHIYGAGSTEGPLWALFAVVLFVCSTTGLILTASGHWGHWFPQQAPDVADAIGLLISTLGGVPMLLKLAQLRGTTLIIDNGRIEIVEWHGRKVFANTGSDVLIDRKLGFWILGLFRVEMECPLSCTYRVRISGREFYIVLEDAEDPETLVDRLRLDQN